MAEDGNVVDNQVTENIRSDTDPDNTTKYTLITCADCNKRRRAYRNWVCADCWLTAEAKREKIRKQCKKNRDK